MELIDTTRFSDIARKGSAGKTGKLGPLGYLDFFPQRPLRNLTFFLSV
jgi:hypothetical protein